MQSIDVLLNLQTSLPRLFNIIVLDSPSVGDLKVQHLRYSVSVCGSQKRENLQAYGPVPSDDATGSRPTARICAISFSGTAGLTRSTPKRRHNSGKRAEYA